MAVVVDTIGADKEKTNLEVYVPDTGGVKVYWNVPAAKFEEVVKSLAYTF